MHSLTVVASVALRELETLLLLGSKLHSVKYIQYTYNAHVYVQKKNQPAHAYVLVYTA